MDKLKEEENSPLISVMPNVACNSHKQSLIRISPMTTQKWISIMPSMRWWCREINWWMVNIKIILNALNSHLPQFWSWWPPRNKICIIEMVQFLVKLHKSDWTKQVDHCRGCTGVAIVAGPALQEYYSWMMWCGGWLWWWIVMCCDDVWCVMFWRCGE